MEPVVLLLIIFIVIAVVLIIIGSCLHRYMFEQEWDDCVHSSIRMMVGMGSDAKCVSYGQKIFITIFGVMAITTFYIIVSILVVYIIDLNAKKASATTPHPSQ
jgi:hypothetical protein